MLNKLKGLKYKDLALSQIPTFIYALIIVSVPPVMEKH